MNEDNIYQPPKSKLVSNTESSENIESIAIAKKLINIATLILFLATGIAFYNIVFAGVLILLSLTIGLSGWLRLVVNMINSLTLKRLYIILTIISFIAPVAVIPFFTVLAKISHFYDVRFILLTLLIAVCLLVILHLLTSLSAQATTRLKENGYQISLLGTVRKIK
ncbi:hypothetical protein [Candidatus Albibeggiatoa sp. nov. BB20]|uniref:hypothetical protein n=1 Tax=Candidatus Albibeggiatoa sp. nov. BB20 TaxID=3162723 RepID=UPI0033657BDD